MTFNDIMKFIKSKEILFAFDLDGTLVDTEKAYQYAWPKACKSYLGINISNDDALKFRSLDAQLGYEFIKSFVNKDFSLTELKRIRNEYMNEYFKIKGPMKMKKGAFEFVSFLKGNGFKVCIASAATVDKVYDTVCKVGLPFNKDEIFSAKDCKRGKPFPDLYLKVGNHFGLPQDKIVVFEDSPNGLKSAHDAGCFVVLIPDLTKAEDMENFDVSFSNFEEVLNLFKSSL
ncbi:MAG: HAD family phosphatase [Alphaproteobacteria bacterium]|nr:HAD family phosphatase [Alphaproteobacteria bacterium]